jgi:putative hemolysin
MTKPSDAYGGPGNLVDRRDIQRGDMPGDPFHIDGLPSAPLRRAVLAAARPFLSWLLQLRTYRALYVQAQAAPKKSFERRALEILDIHPILSPRDFGLIPHRGPLVIAANHPHGALDGLLLASVLRDARPDVRILANHLLSRIPELAELCFFVDPFGGPTAAARSQAGLRAAHVWLKRGGSLIVFPAGEVAHTRRPDESYADSPWRPTIGRMVLATGAQVMPAFIEGVNSRFFYAAGRVHPALRTALLARELLKKRGRAITVRLAQPMAARDLAVTDDAARATQVIRSAVEGLRHLDRLPAASRVEGKADAPTKSDVVSGLSRTDSIATEIARLSNQSCLVESGAFQVFCTEATQIPSALREIGRLREVTYRAVGEGTGRNVDLDEFDDRYLHLFSWDLDRRQIVGAYRIGQTDRILATHGVEGLYTRTLFRYDDRLTARLSPALELGRSFIRAEYQKNYNALLLLWKGIGQFVVRHPDYRVLFGPVSISSRYCDSSQRLLMAFLRQNHLDRDLAELVEAINPSAVKPTAPLLSAIPQSIDDANRLVAQAEADGKGLPILLRQYLKLNARLIGFNVDPNFGDALDALMMVDLTSVNPAILNRYFGRQEAARFLAWHRPPQSADAA